MVNKTYSFKTRLIHNNAEESRTHRSIIWCFTFQRIIQHTSGYKLLPGQFWTEELAPSPWFRWRLILYSSSLAQDTTLDRVVLFVMLALLLHSSWYMWVIDRRIVLASAAFGTLSVVKSDRTLNCRFWQHSHMYVLNRTRWRYATFERSIQNIQSSGFL